MKRNAKGATVDALLLTFVNIIITLISMVIYKLLAVTFSLEEYGIYSSAMLVSTTVTSLTILGLTDAVNFFYTKDTDRERGKKYAYTIFALQFVIGAVAAGVLLLFPKPIAKYFDNPSVASFIPYIAFIPLLTNISSMLHVLFISSQKAKVLAIRNLTISTLKIILIALTCLLIKDIKAVLVITLVLDIGNVVYLLLYCRGNIFSIDLRKADFSLVKEILKYSIPMSAYIFTNALSKNMDKMVIGYLADSEELAIYTIASKELPFYIFTQSFLTVLVPYITRYIANNDHKNASNAFSKYIQISYVVTIIISAGAVVCSRDLMLILYDEKYLVGVGIFVLYIFVDMMKFANSSLIFAVTGNTKELLCYSGSALVLNLVLNIVFYNRFGMIGPALSTVLITVALSAVMLIRSTKLLKCKTASLLNLKQFLLIIVECVFFGLVAMFIGNRFFVGLPVLFSFAFTYLVYFIPLLALNGKRVLRLLKDINAIKMS